MMRINVNGLNQEPNPLMPCRYSIKWRPIPIKIWRPMLMPPRFNITMTKQRTGVNQLFRGTGAILARATLAAARFAWPSTRRTQVRCGLDLREEDCGNQIQEE